jgi:hypothetical protein
MQQRKQQSKHLVQNYPRLSRMVLLTISMTTRLGKGTILEPKLQGYWYQFARSLERLMLEVIMKQTSAHRSKVQRYYLENH